MPRYAWTLRQRDNPDLFSLAGASPEGFSIVAEFYLVCILDEIESLSLNLFSVDQSTYLCLEIFDGDERSLLEICLQRCELRAWKDSRA